MAEENNTISMHPAMANRLHNLNVHLKSEAGHVWKGLMALELIYTGIKAADIESSIVSDALEFVVENTLEHLGYLNDALDRLKDIE